MEEELVKKIGRKVGKITGGEVVEVIGEEMLGNDRKIKHNKVRESRKSKGIDMK